MQPGCNALQLQLQPLQMHKCGLPMHTQRNSWPDNDIASSASKHCTQPDPLQHHQQQEAQPPVLAFATVVAQMLLRHIAEVLPPEVASSLSEQLKQQINQCAAGAAAAGKPFSLTAALEQLLPQLSTIAASTSYKGYDLAAAAPVGSSTAGAGHLTRFDLPGSSQLPAYAFKQVPRHPTQQHHHGQAYDDLDGLVLQQLQQGPPAVASHVSGQRTSPPHLSTALLDLHNSSMGAAPATAMTTPAQHAAATAAAGWVPGPSWQQQVPHPQVLAAMSSCSECGSTCD